MFESLNNVGGAHLRNWTLDLPMVATLKSESCGTSFHAKAFRMHQTRWRRLVVAAIGCLVSASPAGAADDEVWFQRKVEPILVRRCLECHGQDQAGKLDLRTAERFRKGGENGAPIVDRNPDESLL